VRAYTHVLLPVRLFAFEQICRRLYECVFSRSRSLNSSLACSHSLRLSPSSPPSLSLSDSPTLPFTFNMRACVVQAVISAWQTQTHNADTDTQTDVCVCVCARARACVRACECVCVCEREREREGGRERERERESEHTPALTHSLSPSRLRHPHISMQQDV
jgi:hypothetical protein